MRRVFHIVLFLVAFLFFWNTDIQNRTEADDAFEYSSQVEDLWHPWLYHPHHLAYGVLAKKAYRASVAMGYTGRAHGFLVFMSSLSAAASVFLFYRFCYRRYSMRPVSSLFAAGFLALSYGFWRYACEAEVILPAAFFALLAMYLATTPAPGLFMVICAAGVSAVSVLFHIMNAVPVLVAIPLFYLLSRQPRQAAVHMLVTGGLVVSAYAWVYTCRIGLALGGRALPPVVDRLEWALIPKGLVGLGQCLVSGNFLFGYEWFSSKLVALFPYRMLSEEIFMGRHMTAFQRIAPICTFILLCIMVGYGMVRAAASWRREWREQRAGALHMVGGWQTLAVVVFWFSIYAIALLVMEPGNPEVWVLGLVPFWLLVCGVMIAPLGRANELWVVLVMLVLLGLHNQVGGIGLLRSSDSDYNFNKAEWVINHSRASDLIITAGNPVFVRYLKYHADAKVIDVHRITVEQLVEALEDASNTYALNDIFDYPASMRKRFPGNVTHIERVADMLRPRMHKVAENDFGGIWEYVHWHRGIHDGIE
jgi:hypothetical protein